MGNKFYYTRVILAFALSAPFSPIASAQHRTEDLCATLKSPTKEEADALLARLAPIHLQFDKQKKKDNVSEWVSRSTYGLRSELSNPNYNGIIMQKNNICGLGKALAHDLKLKKGSPGQCGPQQDAAENARNKMAADKRLSEYVGIVTRQYKDGFTNGHKSRHLYSIDELERLYAESKKPPKNYQDTIKKMRAEIEDFYDLGKNEILVREYRRLEDAQTVANAQLAMSKSVAASTKQAFEACQSPAR